MDFANGRAPARLLSVATCVPDHIVDQPAVADLVAERFGGKVFRAQDILALFQNTGIQTRRSVRPVAWYASAPSFGERNAVYIEEASRLWREAAAAALDKAGVPASAVSAVVTVSSTGVATPGLEAREGPGLGLPPGCRRTPVFGLGCGGGVAGVSLAARLAAAEPGTVVLLVVVELCTLSVRPEEFTKANVVATSLFGDGSAAAVFSTEGPGRPVERVGEHTWPDTLDIMGWRVDPGGLGVVLDAGLPAFVERRFREASDAFAAEGGFDASTRFVCHPGGAKVLTALERALDLEEGTLNTEREVLSAFGNMSAPTVFFVLERMARAHPETPLALAALGPGFSAHFARLGALHG